MKRTSTITSKSIEQSGLPTDYRKAITEYIWNSFDAKAKTVKINYVGNEIGFIQSFEIADDGEGIDINTLDNTFGHFLDSSKTTSFEKDGFVRGCKVNCVRV